MEAFKKCGCCGRSHTKASWAGLKFRGIQPDDVEPLEYRDCFCGSTLAVIAQRVLSKLVPVSPWGAY